MKEGQLFQGHEIKCLKVGSDQGETANLGTVVAGKS
jgi:hypothetical protein